MAIDGKELRSKDDANISFDRKGYEDALDEREKKRQTEAAQKATAPQPTLTPDGALRKQTDARIREKQEAIKAKMRADRERERGR